MTDQEVAGGFRRCTTISGFDIGTGSREKPLEWERIHTQAVVLKRKYPLLEEAINRMVTEIIERARGRGRKEKDFHRPPR